MEKQRFWLYRREGIYYLHDSETRKRESLNTRNRREAEQIRVARNQASDHPQPFGASAYGTAVGSPAKSTPNLCCICSKEIPLVSGTNIFTQISCNTIMNAKNANT